METTMFRDKPLEKRKDIFQSLMREKSDRVAVVMLNGNNNSALKLQKKKYLIPANMTLCNFMVEIKSRLKMNSEEALFITFNGKIYAQSITMGEIYVDCKDPEDGFLYGTYNVENTFG